MSFFKDIKTRRVALEHGTDSNGASTSTSANSLRPDSVQPTTRYTIDREDRIEAVDPAWLEFARENDAIRLNRDAVVGRCLWDFVAGGETRHLYELLFRRIRNQGSDAVLPFRCDSPSVRRFMVLHMNPTAEGGIELRAELARSEQRKPVRLLDPAVPRAEDFLTICSWCKQVLLPTGRWVEAEEAVAALGLFMANQLPRLTHAICPVCQEHTRAEVSSSGGH